MSAPSIIAQTPPIVGELEAIFASLPDTELLMKLRGPKRRGRPGYDPQILWRCYVTYYTMGVESVSALIRLLADNPFIAEACGIHGPSGMPSQPTFSRFGSRLSRKWIALEVKNIMRALTRRLYETLADFGKSVAIDSTHIKAWSNPVKKGKKRIVEVKRQRSKVGKVSDPDAGWVVKPNTHGKREFIWGFKVHVLCDTKYELPLVVDVTRGNFADVKKATPLLQQARYTHGKFHPEYVICDAAYSSTRLRRAIRNQYWAKPIIDPNPAHKRAARLEKTPKWKAVYNRRTAIERLNSRLKAFYKLDTVRVRGRMKLRVHALLSVIALQARALAFPNQLRKCVRAVL